MRPSRTPATAGIGDLVDVTSTWDHLLAAHDAVRDAQALEPDEDRPPERPSDADRDLVAAGVAGLVAEEQEVERPGLGFVRADGVHDGRGRGLRVPLLPVR